MTSCLFSQKLLEIALSNAGANIGLLINIWCYFSANMETWRRRFHTRRYSAKIGLIINDRPLHPVFDIIKSARIFKCESEPKLIFIIRIIQNNMYV